TTGRRLCPTGNIVGDVGGAITPGAWGFFGSSGFLLPLLPAAWATHVLGRVGRATAWRATGLLASAGLLGPTAIYAFASLSGRVPATAGWFGVALGAPLAAVFGWLGAGLLLTFALAAVCVATLGWNPLRSLVRGGRSALGGARRGAVDGATLLPQRTASAGHVSTSWQDGGMILHKH